MSDQELIARLREACRGGDGCKCSLSEAADRIEALIAERDEANKRGDAWRFRADIAEVKLAKAVEALGGLMPHMPDYADTAWQDARATLAEIKGESHE